MASQLRFGMVGLESTRRCGEIVALVVFLASATLAEDQAVISPATHEDGVFTHEVESPFQQGKTKLRVLLPDNLRADDLRANNLRANDLRANNLRPDEKLPVIYVLPVEAQDEARYGDGLAEAKSHDLHNKHRTIFVAPTFSHLPWYADHPTDKAIRQESYFLKVVVPFIERTYPARAEPSGRLLLGFSKSGWGAWCLLLRHPDVFGRAAAWDAPLMMDQAGKYGSGPIFGTPENFQKYKISDLLRGRDESPGNRKRLVLIGYGNFRSDHERVHALLDELGISHEYRDGPQRKHDWHSGWLPEAVELLVAPK